MEKTKKKFLDIELSDNDFVNYTVLTGSLVLILSIVLNGYFSYQNYLLFPPNNLSSDRNGTIIFNIEDDLYSIDKDTNIVAESSYETLKYDNVLGVDFIGDKVFMIGRNGRITMCNADLRGCTRTDSFYISERKTIDVDVLGTESGFYILYDGDLRSYDAAGYFEHMMSFEKRFIPHRLARYDQNRSAALDYNNHIMIFENTDHTEIKAVVYITLDIGSKVLNFAFDNARNLWFTTGNGLFYVNAASIKSTIDKSVVRTISSEHIIEPLNIIPYFDGILMSDIKSMKILSIHNDTVRPIENEHLRPLLDSLKEVRSRNDSLSTILYTTSFLSIGFLIIAFLVESRSAVLFPNSLKYDIEHAYELLNDNISQQPDNPLVWLKPEKMFIPQPNAAEIAFTVMAFAAVQTVFFLSVDTFMLQLYLIISLPLLYLLAKNDFINPKSVSIGFDNEYIYFKSKTLNQRARFEDVIYSDFVIYINKAKVSSNIIRMFNKEALMNSVFHRLSTARYLGLIDLYGYHLRNLHVPTFAGTLLFVVTLLYLFAVWNNWSI